jgi:hypothetical protein
VLRSDALLSEHDARNRARAVRGRRTQSVLTLPNVPAIRGEIRALAVRAGFGQVFWLEETWTPKEGEERPLAGLASYLVKLSRTLGVDGAPGRRGGEKLAGELTRSALKPGDQTPISAPIGFRRIRASRGILPPRYRGNPAWTGALGASSDPAWTWGVARNVNEARELKVEGACRAIEELEGRGLPIPDAVRRVLACWRRRSQSPKSSEESSPVSAFPTSSP